MYRPRVHSLLSFRRGSCWPSVVTPVSPNEISCKSVLSMIIYLMLSLCRRQGFLLRYVGHNFSNNDNLLCELAIYVSSSGG
jgi:hypothetical protein